MQSHVHLPPDPLAGKAVLQDDLRNHDLTQGGPGGQDRAVEPHHQRDHLPQDQEQIQPLDQAPHPGGIQDHEADRQYQRHDEMRKRVEENKDVVKKRNCMSEHPFGTIKRGFNQGYRPDFCDIHAKLSGIVVCQYIYF
jgi:hypothetical protein